MRFSKLPMLALPFVLACTPTTGDDDFVGGEFTLTITSVADACNDGALEVIFLPDGAGSTADFQDPIYIPAVSELPWTGDIPLRDPFASINVTMDGTATTRTIDDALNADILLDDDSYPGCKVDLTSDATLSVDDSDSVSGTIIMTMSNVIGDQCPTVTDGCTMTLDIRGARN